MATTAESTLRSTLTKMRTRIAHLREHGERLSEQDTKTALINPVLAALGWRLDEFSEVRQEYRAKPQDNPVDYALLDFGRPCLFIEAKALGVALDRKCASQVVGYASTVGVDWCLLTNGDQYRLYKAHASVDVDEKLLRSVRLSDPDDEACSVGTLALIARDAMCPPDLERLWKSQFVDRRVQATLDRLFGPEIEPLARLVRKHAGELTATEVRESLQRAQVHVHFPVMTLKPSGVASPTATPFPQASSVSGEGDPALPSTGHEVRLKDLIDAGLVESPLVLQKLYKGVLLEAVVGPDGLVEFDGQSYESLSAAAGMARKSIVGAPPGRQYPATNGWEFWRCQDGAGESCSVGRLRQRYLEQQAQ